MRHLIALDAEGTTRSTADLVSDLRELHDDVVAIVPSCHRLSFVLQRSGGPVTVTVGDPTGPSAPSSISLASMTIPLHNTTGDLLVLESRVRGAFLLFVEELRGVLGPESAPVVDGDLDSLFGGAGGSSPQSFGDVRLLDQAIGLLLDRGLGPGEAVEELRRRASVEGRTPAEIAARLFADLPRPPPPTQSTT